jgi:hypothetical protein
MDAKQARYADLIECSARVLAFDGLVDAALPDLVSVWTSEAIDLCNGWVSFSPDVKSRSGELPIVDAVIAEVRARADALRREIFDHIHPAAERGTDALAQPIEFKRNTAKDVATRMREYLAEGRKQRRRSA